MVFQKDGEALKKLGYIIFGFPCFAGIVLFLKFDSANGYCFEFLYDRMGLQELGITFHLGLNGVSKVHSLPWRVLLVLVRG